MDSEIIQSTIATTSWESCARFCQGIVDPVKCLYWGFYNVSNLCTAYNGKCVNDVGGDYFVAGHYTCTEEGLPV